MIVLDASVAIAALDARERRHSEAVEIMARSDEDFLMRSVNLAEVLVLAERQGRGEALVQDFREIAWRRHRHVR
ncbi:PIN domain-containing protein [Occultella kanbiaonis]|uniref:PIN domain-containing protein n=1 Tax=Occultella kanbiaonis TaxID=2675754 RepID=UPI0013D81355|nr:PIN domain-containing protein [Occultella kanbiaonis]